MAALKMQNGWLLPKRPLLIDTQLVLNKNQKLISFWWFLPAIILTFAGGFYSLQTAIGSWILFLITVLMLSLFIGGYYFIARLPVKPLTSDSKINQQINDLFRHHWSVLMVLSALVFAPLTILPTFTIVIDYTVAMTLTFCYFILLFVYVGFLFYYLFSMRKKQDQFVLQAGDYRYGDDDQYWRYGIYINPKDPKIMVPDRIGMNLSINLGRPAGKIILAATGILTIAVLFFATVPMFINDFSSHAFQATIEKNQIELSAPLAKTRSIPFNQITAVSLIDDLPQERIRTMGAATDSYLTGEFKVAGKPAYLLIYTKSHPILKIETREKVYYYTAREGQETTKIYQEIKSKLHNKKTGPTHDGRPCFLLFADNLEFCICQRGIQFILAYFTICCHNGCLICQVNRNIRYAVNSTKFFSDRLNTAITFHPINFYCFFHFTSSFSILFLTSTSSFHRRRFKSFF